MIEYQYSELDLIEIYIYKSILFKIKNYIQSIVRSKLQLMKRVLF